MGRMHIRNEGRVVGDYGRDARSFGHYIENLRDSLLNQAERVEFGVQGVKWGSPGRGGKRYPTKEPQVVRRTIADDGTGMSETTLKEVYCNLAVSGTDFDFALDVQPDATSSVTLVPYEEDDVYNARRGFGGRGTLYRFNKMGVVTVSIYDGVPRMTWMFADLDGNPCMRDYLEEDRRGLRKTTEVVLAYEEPAYLTRSDLMADLEWSKQLLVRTGELADGESAEAWIRSMGPEDGISNPYVGIDWQNSDVVPDWVAHHWGGDEYKDSNGKVQTYDGDESLMYREGGTLAHGTIKVLLGDHINHSTAITGDPFYDVESTPMKVNGVGNQFWAYLKPHWNVTVSAARKPSARDRKAGRPSHFEIKGYPDDVWMLEHREQHGLIPRRTENSETEIREGLSSPNLWQGTLDLGEYGRMVVLYARPLPGKSAVDPDSPSRRDGMWQSWRGGAMGVVYGLEMHGFYGDSLKMTKGAALRMGFPFQGKEQDQRLTTIWVPPRIKVTADGQTILRDGVHQTSARDRIKWSGKDLPLSTSNGLYDTVANAVAAQAPDLLAIIRDENATVSNTEVDVKDMPNIAASFTEFIETSEKSRKKDSSKSSALIKDPDGTERGDEIPPGGERSGEERPDVVCEHGCTGKFHQEGCPLHKSGGGGGGPRPKDQERLEPNPGGEHVGRKSRARGGRSKTTTTTTPKVTTTPPKPPSVDVVAESDFPGDNLRLPAFWVPPNPLLEVTSDSATSMQTGMVTVNKDHPSYKALEGYAIKNIKKRNKSDIRGHVEQWIKDRTAEALLSYLALKDEELASTVGVKEKDDLKAWLLEEEGSGNEDRPNAFWIGAFAAMFSARKSLITYVTNKSPVEGAEAIEDSGEDKAA